jgi:hypothetical protein
LGTWKSQTKSLRRYRGVGSSAEGLRMALRGQPAGKLKSSKPRPW